MPSFVSFLALGVVLPLAIAGNVFEKLDALPKGWTYVRPAQPDEQVKLRVSLRQQNVEFLEQLVLDISTPGHDKYGQHLEGHEVKAILKPRDEASDAVLGWLKEHQVSAVHDDGDWINFRTSIATANKMLDTQFAWYQAEELGQQRLRTLEYSVPSPVAAHINFVQPTIKFGSTRPMRSLIHATGSDEAVALFEAWKATTDKSAPVAAPPDSVCNQSISPLCLLKLYNVHYAGSASNGNKVAYASYLEQYARYSDLTAFENSQATYAKGKNFSVVEFSGGLNDQTASSDSTEANLDNQYILGVGYPTPVTEFSTAGRGPQIPDPNEPAGVLDNEPYLEFLNGILALPNSQLPQTLSTSYGDDEQTIPVSFANQVCNMFMQLGARGVSVLFSSGDSGPGAICQDNSGTVTKFIPTFPAGCPFVTSVGATQNINPERAASFSSGGFSNYFARPSYQDSAVTAYLSKLGNKYAPYFNASGRGIPDISAQGVNYLVVNSGTTIPVGGTSCSSPTLAGIVALLNSARISSGQPTLGFLNPFLYSQGVSALNDVTVGRSTGCSGQLAGASWDAVTGWDPVTGLGTPNFGKLLALVAPQACNVGGVLPNPTLSACGTSAKATATGTATGTKSTTLRTVKTTASATKA